MINPLSSGNGRWHVAAPRSLMLLVAVIFGFSITQSHAQSCNVVWAVDFTGTTQATVTNTTGALQFYEGCISSAFATQYNLTVSVNGSSVGPPLSGGDGAIYFDMTLPSPNDTTTLQGTVNDAAFNGDIFICGLSSPLPSIALGGAASAITTNGCRQGPPTAVPTLSQWGLIILGLSVLCLGAVAIIRQRKRFAPQSS